MMATVILIYEPVATFELRPSNTTKSGGKTLLSPTPYAIKMALLDRMIRFNGLVDGRERFARVRDLNIAVRLPMAVAVNRTFQKILRPKGRGEWNPTIAMREFCVQAGTLEMAISFESDDSRFLSVLVQTAAAVNYFGQRGSFYQLVDYDDNPSSTTGFVDISHPVTGLQPGFLQRMDNMSPDAEFDDVNVFNPKANGGRYSYNVVFPYRLAHNGFNHTVWNWQENIT